MIIVRGGVVLLACEAAVEGVWPFQAAGQVGEALGVIRDAAEDEDEERDDPREDGSVDEELRNRGSSA